jgi:hypothetical protein
MPGITVLFAVYGGLGQQRELACRSSTTKHFGAIVEVVEQRLAFACQENQTIDFS